MNAIEHWTGELPDGWTGGQQLTKWWRGKYVHLYTLRKPCAQCSREMRIDVSKAALEGTAKNAGLHLKRCKICRDAAKALRTNSRPHVEGEEQLTKPIDPQTADEILRTANATMKEEIEGLYAQNKELRERLARYEMAPAMEAVASGQRMPWEH